MMDQLLLYLENLNGKKFFSSKSLNRNILTKKQTGDQCNNDANNHSIKNKPKRRNGKQRYQCIRIAKQLISISSFLRDLITLYLLSVKKQLKWMVDIQQQT